MMRDVFGRPIGPGSPWNVRRAPVRPVPAPLTAPRVPFELPLEEELAAWAPSTISDEARETPAPPAAAASPALSAALQLAEARAELEASRARLAREAIREREADKLGLVREMLPALDDLDRSIAAARQDGNVEPALLEGFELVRTRLERVLQGYGLERIVAIGERFDPALHEAIALVQVDDARQSGIVVDEIERGYRAGDRVLRAARVRVGVSA